MVKPSLPGLFFPLSHLGWNSLVSLPMLILEWQWRFHNAYPHLSEEKSKSWHYWKWSGLHPPSDHVSHCFLPHFAHFPPVTLTSLLFLQHSSVFAIPTSQNVLSHISSWLSTSRCFRSWLLPHFLSEPPPPTSPCLLLVLLMPFLPPLSSYLLMCVIIFFFLCVPYWSVYPIEM